MYFSYCITCIIIQCRKKNNFPQSVTYNLSFRAKKDMIR